MTITRFVDFVIAGFGIGIDVRRQHQPQPVEN